MSATSLNIVTIVFPDATSPVQLGSNNSFNQAYSFDITTLSTTSVEAGDQITGLVYVPTVAEGSACYNASIPYVPANVTRQQDFPPGNYEVIAIAPWLGPDCVEQYLAAARTLSTQAFITFLPGNDTLPLPNATSPAWMLSNDESWKTENPFPVYAIPATKALAVLNASAQYSGNLTTVPYGHQLAEQFPTSDYVRLFAKIDTSGAGSLPSLWIFLLVVLAILFGIIALTSLTMHILQRRRRANLRRRVANGEVDLEALGIKRLTVPQHLLDEMPLYTYGSESKTRTKKQPTSNTKSPSDSMLPDFFAPQSGTRVSKEISTYNPTALQQTTCAICLDDFMPADPKTNPAGTTVRELPCHHIFHPDCVDAFLRDSSSLCPMCKKSSLPKGYCPRVITNAMVRRERMVRRLRTLDQERGGGGGGGEVDGEEISTGGRRGAGGSSRRRHPLSHWTQLRRFQTLDSPPAAGARREVSSQQMRQLGPPRPGPPEARSSATLPAETATVPLEDLSTAPAPADTAAAAAAADTPRVSPENQSRRSAHHREWARQRALAMLGPRHDRVPVDPDAEEAARTPRWRKALRGVFPGFGGGRDGG